MKPGKEVSYHSVLCKIKAALFEWSVQRSIADPDAKQAVAFQKYDFCLLYLLCPFSSLTWRISSGHAYSFSLGDLLCRAFMGVTFRPAFAVASLLSSSSLSIFPDVLSSIPQFSESTHCGMSPLQAHSFASVWTNSHSSYQAMRSMFWGGCGNLGKKKHQSFKKSRAGEWDKTKQSLFSVLKAPVSRVLTVCRGGRNHQMPCEGTSAATVGRFLLKCFTTNGTHFFLTAPRGMWDLSSPTRDGIQAPCSGSVKSNHWTPGKSLMGLTFWVFCFFLT